MKFKTVLKTERRLLLKLSEQGSKLHKRSIRISKKATKSLKYFWVAWRARQPRTEAKSDPILKLNTSKHVKIESICIFSLVCVKIVYSSLFPLSIVLSNTNRVDYENYSNRSAKLATKPSTTSISTPGWAPISVSLCTFTLLLAFILLLLRVLILITFSISSHNKKICFASKLLYFY